MASQSKLFQARHSSCSPSRSRAKMASSILLSSRFISNLQTIFESSKHRYGAAFQPVSEMRERLGALAIKRMRRPMFVGAELADRAMAGGIERPETGDE